MVVIGILEIIVAVSLLLHESMELKMSLIAILSANFLLYRILLFASRATVSCSWFGALESGNPLVRAVNNWGLIFMIVGSYAYLIRFVLLRDVRETSALALAPEVRK